MKSLADFPTPPRPAATIAEVLDRMRAIDAELAPANGVSRFNRLYLETTENVVAALSAGRFVDRAFTERLDVVFANLYFDAIIKWVDDPEIAPRAWAALFESRLRADVAPIQFALAGMNAHINFDLGVAVLRTCEERGVAPRLDGAPHRDFLTINAILAETFDRVKPQLYDGLLATMDASLGRVDDVVALWSIARARDAAWTHAEVLWTLRGHALLSSAYIATLDQTVSLSGRALLLPTRLPPGSRS